MRPRMRRQVISRHLTLNDAVVIWQRRLAGEAQHKIAAVFDVNQGRVSEILAGKRFPAARRLALGTQREASPAEL